MSKLYTGKGDGGTTKLFGCDQKRISKSSAVVEALGTLDEFNSFLGVMKIKSARIDFKIGNFDLDELLYKIQETLFTIQAHVAGSDKSLSKEKIKELEDVIAKCEDELPPITVFSIPGGTELSALLDFTRTLARRTERWVVAVHDELENIAPEVLQYLNRLSSLFFALARLHNLRSGIKESAPSYN